MIRIRRSFLRRIGVAAIAAGVIVAGATSMVSASQGVTITSPAIGVTDVYFDANNNGVNDPAEFVGTFPIYTGSGIAFHWQPYTFPAGVNGSYFITLWQNTTPLAAQPTWVLRRAAHDFADNPAGTNYLMGPFFTSEHFCNYCPSMIVVELETYQNINNTIVYTPLTAALDDSPDPDGFATSFGFVVTDVTDSGHPDNDNNNKSSGPTCSSPNQSETCCHKLKPSYTWTGDACQPPKPPDLILNNP